LVNHLGAEAGPRCVFERSIAPGGLGWRPEFRWQRLARWAERHGGVRVLERRAMPPLGHFSLIRFQRLAAGRKVDGRQHARQRATMPLATFVILAFKDDRRVASLRRSLFLPRLLFQTDPEGLIATSPKIEARFPPEF